MIRSALEAELESARRSLEELPLEVGRDGEKLDLLLRRVPWPGGPVTRSVLLLHGGNSSGDTFLLPDGGFAGYLSRKGVDVWLLEWRGSPYVMRDFLKREPLPRTGTVMGECRMFSVDNVAEHDIPGAVKHIRSTIKDAPPIAILGHCLSGGALAMSVAAGYLERLGVTNIVLCTLGLFYEVPWDGWVKVEDFILERILSASPECRAIDPTLSIAWPPVLEECFKQWPSAWKPGGRRSIDDLLRRVSFMVGQPWTADRLADGLHGDALRSVFGPFHLGLYLHCGQMVRRAFAARFNRPDVLDRARLPRAPSMLGDTSLAADYMRPEHFQDKDVTLVAATDNRLWHRDSIDLMYEWLRNETRPDSPTRHQKKVFPGYNLQELFWGKHAAEDVYPRLHEALTR